MDNETYTCIRYKIYPLPISKKPLHLEMYKQRYYAINLIKFC